MPSEKLQIILELVTGQYKREAQEAATATGRIASAIEQAGGSANRLGPAMTSAGRAMAGFGAAAIGSLGLAAKAAIDWESAFAGVRKTVEASEPEFAALEQGLLDMSLAAPVAAEELAGIAEAAGQLGIKNEAILDFTKTMAALGVTTNLTADEAATAFARIANVMEIPQDQFDEMGSTVVGLGNKLASTESEIVDFATRIAGAGKIAGLSAADVFAIGGAFSSVGVEAEAGGTAIQKVLLDMTESVATGGGNLETFARVAGVTAQEFVRTWQDDPAKAFTLFVEGLGRAGDDAFGILEELGLADQRLIRAFLSMAGAGDLLNTSLGLGNDLYRENIALTAEAEKRYATVASELQIFVNSIKVLAIEIGNTLLPAIRLGADAAKTLVEWFTNMPEPLKIAVVALTGLVGAVSLFGGAALILIPRIAATITAVRDLRLAILALRAANLAGAVGGTGGAATAATTGGIAGMATAVGILGAAVLALEVGIRAAKGATDEWTDSSNEWQRVAGGYIQGLDTLSVLTGNFSGAILGAAGAMEKTKDVNKDTTREIHDSWMNAAEGPTFARDAIIGPDGFVPAALEAVTKALAMRDANRLAARSFRTDLTDAIDDFVTFFEGAVDEIDTSLDELESNFEERTSQSQRFFDGLAVLARAGLDDLVAEIGNDVTLVDVVEDLVADMDRAFDWERRIEDSRRQAAAQANAIANGLEGEKNTLLAVFTRFGIDLADALEAGFSTADLGNTMAQLMDMANPAGVTTPGGGSGPGGDFQKFQHGGVVSGPMGSPRLILAHGGETVLTPGQAASWSGGDMLMSSQWSGGTMVTNSPTINVYHPNTYDLNMDLQLATIRATVTNMVEVQS